MRNWTELAVILNIPPCQRSGYLAFEDNIVTVLEMNVDFSNRVRTI